MDKYAVFSSPFGPADSFKDSVNTNDSVFSSSNADSVFGSSKGKQSKSPFGDATSDSTYGGFSDTAFGGFGDSDSDLGGAITPAEDPFGTVDPFKDVDIKEDEKFSWDNEPDPFMTDSGIDSCLPNSSGDVTVSAAPYKKDPFNVSFDANKNVIDGIEVRSVNRNSVSSSSNVVDKTNSGGDDHHLFSDLNDSKTDNFLNIKATLPGGTDSSASAGVRSKSVLADPIANLFSKQFKLPIRSKTALADPIVDLESFDPLASTGKSPKKTAWLSNEDLINETFGSGKNSPANFGTNSTNNTEKSCYHSKQDAFGFSSNSFGSSTANAFNNNNSVDFDSAFGGSNRATYSFAADFGDASFSSSNNNNQTRNVSSAMSESDQLNWAAKDSLKLENQRQKKFVDQEKAELAKALALSAVATKQKKNLSPSFL